MAVAARPDYVNFCNCTLCRRSAGAGWVYSDPARVTISGETRGFVRPDMAAPDLTTHFCPTCGATVAWVANDPGYARMGVAAGLFAGALLAGLEARFPDGLADSGAGERPPPRHPPGVVRGDGLP